MHSNAESLAPERRETPFRFSGWMLALLALALAALIVSRKPAVLLQAELWGDDGWTWYPDAYRAGMACLLWPVNGYLNSLQRLVGIAVQPFPLAWVPTLFAVVALAVQVAPAAFLLSSRMEEAWQDLRSRLAFAVIFAVLPNEIEFYVNLTNAQWTLAILAFLVLVSAPPRSAAAAVFDAIVLVLSGLSGPFCLFLLPIAVWQAAARRDRTCWFRLGLIAGTALVQIGCLLGAPHAGRSMAPLGAGPRTFARIVAFNILLGAEIGYHGIAALPQTWPVNGLAGKLWPAVVTGTGGVAATIALWRGTRLLRQWTLFATLAFAAALVRPQVSAHDPQWPIMAIPPMGNRYYGFAMLAWLAMLFALAADHGRANRLAGWAGLALMILWGIPGDWAEPRFPPAHFAERARAFEAAPPGTRMAFPVVPPGLPSMMVLTKPAAKDWLSIAKPE